MGRPLSTMILFLGVSALACASGDTDSEAEGDTDTDTDSDADTDDGWGPHDPVTIGFSGEVATVSGTPFVWDAAIRTAPVTGSFTYDRGAPDDAPGVADRAVYDLGPNGAFTLTLDGHTLSQSAGPVVEINGNTFRFVDGTDAGTYLDDADVERVMKFDGVDDPTIGLWTSFVKCGIGECPLPEALPAGPDFYFLDHATADYAHTFSLTDDAGTLLIQLDAMYVVD